MFPELVTRSDLEVFLPPIGGQTVYMFGDVAAPRRPARAAHRARARRVQRLRRVRLRHLHLPALPDARDRGVHPRRAGGRRRGSIVYNRKEGRALGEVTKFLVYNARKRQEGGDRADQYFAAHRVRGRRAGHALPGADARRAALARHPQDPSLRLDEQHEVRRHRAARASRSASACTIPDDLIPADARVEMDAKMAAGYFTERRRCPTPRRARADQGPRPASDGRAGGRRPRSTAAASPRGDPRARAARCWRRGRRAAGSTHFAIDLSPARRGRRARRRASRASAIRPRAIPSHSRWRHFDAGGVDRLAELERAARRRSTPTERARARIDLVVDQRAARRRRRAALALRRAGHRRDVRALRGPGGGELPRCSCAGAFSADPATPLRVDADGAGARRRGRLGAASSRCRATIRWSGSTGRAALLRRLGARAAARGPSLRCRRRAPGRTCSTLLRARARARRGVAARATSCARCSIGLRPDLAGPTAAATASTLGDVWPHPARRRRRARRGLVPFHKLSQWLAYSLLEPLERAGVRGDRTSTRSPAWPSTATAACCSTPACSCRAPRRRRCASVHRSGDELVVEWRALTVALLDRARRRACARALGAPRASCRWRASSKAAPGPPAASSRPSAARRRRRRIRVASDGTVF